MNLHILHPPSNYISPLCIAPTAASCNLHYTLSFCIRSLLLVLTEQGCHSVGSIWEYKWTVWPEQ